MEMSVLFASHNGEKTLPLMLEAMTRVAVPRDGLEVIAVNNGSTDRTPEILLSFSERLNIQIVDVPERGKNRALNRGLTCTTGEVVVLTDDDIIPNTDWLLQMRNCVRANPDFAVFGGRIEPCWPGELPDYVKKHVPLSMVYALTEDNQPDGPVDPQLVWGPNMAVRREVFDKGFRFNEDVGPAAGTYVMGSETEFTSRLSKHGYSCYFSNAPVVQHIIRDHQFTKDWLWGRSTRSGKGYCLNNIVDHRKKFNTLFGVPIWIMNRCIAAHINYLWLSMVGSGDLAFAERFRASRWKGYIIQALKQ